ncbi:MAG TPA: hypothetical protein VK996_19980 [Ramlibacter sp.]|nr:hypothetical protein [Ramlibacter sp.]
MTTAEYLASLGVTMDQAYDWIVANANDPAYIHSIAAQFGITNAMLADIVGCSADDVRNYFSSQGLDPSLLDPVVAPLETDHFFPPDQPFYAQLLALDTYPGVVSLQTIREQVIAGSNVSDYEELFDVSTFVGAADGLFTLEELGFAHLGALPATNETIESVFYGTIIAAFKAVDFGEVLELVGFMESNQEGLANDDPATLEQFSLLMLDIFLDPTSEPLLDDADIAEYAISATISLVNLVGAGQTPNLFEDQLALLVSF